MNIVSLSRSQARRIALAAQLIGRPKPSRPAMRQVNRVIDRLAQFQIDSVNVLVRAHLMPLLSRLGPYDTQLLSNAASGSPRRLFEYWGHAASLIDIALYPALRHRMDREWNWPGIDRVRAESPELIDSIIAEVASQGPVTAREVSPDSESHSAAWWGWSQTKNILEWLVATGILGVAGRTSSFERRYDLLERVIPLADQPILDVHDAHLVLVRRAAAALGVASERCLTDYFRTRPAPTRAAITELERQGELIPAQIAGWRAPTWIWHQAARPRRVDVCTLVSPFDSLVFERRRLADLFDVDYRIEIYVPAAKRVYGYYVYLMILGDEIAARVDLKADRRTGRLLVQSAWLEPTTTWPAEVVARRLNHCLTELMDWLSLTQIHFTDRGTLAEVVRGLAS